MRVSLKDIAFLGDPSVTTLVHNCLMCSESAPTPILYTNERLVLPFRTAQYCTIVVPTGQHVLGRRTAVSPRSRSAPPRGTAAGPWQDLCTSEPIHGSNELAHAQHMHARCGPFLPPRGLTG